MLDRGKILNDFDPIAEAIGTLVIMVLYSFLTVRIEGDSIAGEKPDFDKAKLWKTVWLMNLVTYLILAIALIFGLVWMNGGS